MDIGKIVRLVAVLVAVLAGFINLPEEAAVIAVLGAVGGFFVEKDQTQQFLIVALALALVHGALGPVWVVGKYLTYILASLSGLYNAAACTVIVVRLVERLKP
jgi:hypothetical protein